MIYNAIVSCAKYIYLLCLFFKLNLTFYRIFLINLIHNIMCNSSHRLVPDIELFNIIYCVFQLPQKYVFCIVTLYVSQFVCLLACYTHIMVSLYK